MTSSLAPKRGSSSPSASSKPARPAPPGDQGMQFLFLDASAGAEQCRKGARSFVMRKARHERPWSTAKKDSNGVRRKSEPYPKKQPSPRAISRSTEPLRTRQTSTKSSSTASASPTEPVAASPRASTPRAALGHRRTGSASAASASDSARGAAVDDAAMVAYWHQVLVGGMVPSNGQRCSLAIRETAQQLSSRSLAVQEAIACVVAMADASASVAADEPESKAWQHHLQAVRAVNDALTAGGSGGKPDYDAMILAMLLLLSIEHSLQQAPGHDVLVGSSSDRRANYQACLRQLIRLKGGLLQLRNSNRVMYDLLMWHSAAQAVDSVSVERLRIDIGDFDGSYGDAPRLMYPPGFFTFTSLAVRLRISPRLVRLAQDATLMSVEFDEAYQSPDGEGEASQLQTRCSLMQLRLILLHQELGFSAFDVSGVEQSLALGLLCFLTQASLPTAPNLKRMQAGLARKLKHFLLGTSNERWASSPGALLWLVVWGTLCSHGTADMSWWTQQLGDGYQALSVGSADELNGQLQQLIWPNSCSCSLTPFLWQAHRSGPEQHALRPDSLFRRIASSKHKASVEETRPFPGAVQTPTWSTRPGS